MISHQELFCPVEISLQYLSLRRGKPGSLFVLADGSPVIRSYFTAKLSIKCGGFDPSPYKGHSFRIGVGSYAADAGMLDAQIMAFGRWKSNAFLKYICTPSLTWIYSLIISDHVTLYLYSKAYLKPGFSNKHTRTSYCHWVGARFYDMLNKITKPVLSHGFILLFMCLLFYVFILVY